jgi:hypothetical protein
MAVNDESIGKFKSGCRFEKCEFEKGDIFNRDLFSRDWEVFVIKRDETTGKLVGKLACCALSPVYLKF